MIQLPLPFIQEMRQLFIRFGQIDEWQAFLDSFQEEPCTGLRAHTQKIEPEQLRRYLARLAGLSPEEIRPVPWCPDGFYSPPGLRPGRLSAHAAGLYYIQEPSAMLPATVLAAKPGERILDLCAAPGGKATKIAADMQCSGLLLANDVSDKRVRALNRTLELAGCVHAVITKETPERLAQALPSYFDAVLADVPCSGSGMFRRDPAAISNWQRYGPEYCVDLQREILKASWRLLRPGGRLVYSTCSFSLSENEAMMDWFCKNHEDCQIVPIPKVPGVDDGWPLNEKLHYTARIWPHHADGDGHFCALLRKSEGPETKNDGLYRPCSGQDTDWQLFDSFCRDLFTESGKKRQALWMKNIRRVENDRLYLVPPCPAALNDLCKVKTGLFLGSVHKRKGKAIRFEPSQALLLSLDGMDINRTIGGPGDGDLVRRCLMGETLVLPEGMLDKNWPRGAILAVLLQEEEGTWPLSWARMMTSTTLKNMYPSGWTRPIDQ